jgi:hypothetical protein
MLGRPSFAAGLENVLAFEEVFELEGVVDRHEAVLVVERAEGQGLELVFEPLVFQLHRFHKELFAVAGPDIDPLGKMEHSLPLDYRQDMGGPCSDLNQQGGALAVCLEAVRKVVEEGHEGTDCQEQ